MKILISDFDGTLKTKDDKINKYNTDMIKKFQSNGNLFCIATGRPLYSLKVELDKLDVCVDYYICQNGATIFDKDLNLLECTTIDKEKSLEIVDKFGKDKAIMYYLSTDTKLTFYCNDADSKKRNEEYTNVSNDKKQFFMVSHEDIIRLDNYVQVGFKYITTELAQLYTKKINSEFKDYFSAETNNRNIDVVKNNISKELGINKFLQKINYYDKVYTIGDNYNDISMLKAFDSFAIKRVKEVEESANYVVDNLGDALENNIGVD